MPLTYSNTSDGKIKDIIASLLLTQEEITKAVGWFDSGLITPNSDDYKICMYLKSLQPSEVKLITTGVGTDFSGNDVYFNNYLGATYHAYNGKWYFDPKKISEAILPTNPKTGLMILTSVPYFEYPRYDVFGDALTSTNSQAYINDEVTWYINNYSKLDAASKVLVSAYIGTSPSGNKAKDISPELGSIWYDLITPSVAPISDSEIKLLQIDVNQLKLDVSALKLKVGI